MSFSSATIFSLLYLLPSIICDLSPDQKKLCEQYTSAFETHSIHLNYGFCRDLEDGNGFTAGRSRFTTKSGDVYEVVRRYSLWKPFNPLSEYQSELRRLKDSKSGDVSRLKAFDRAWLMSAHDRLFRRVQDSVNDDLYYRYVIRGRCKRCLNLSFAQTCASVVVEPEFEDSFKPMCNLRYNSTARVVSDGQYFQVHHHWQRRQWTVGIGEGGEVDQVLPQTKKNHFGRAQEPAFVQWMVGVVR